MIYLVSIGVYLLVLTGIAAWRSRQVKNHADFTVAGRTLSPWVLVCTMLAVWIGTGSIVGNAGKAYESGLATLLVPLGSVLGIVVLCFIAPRARVQDVYSVPELIDHRYGRTARLLAVFALVTAYMVIVSYQFNALGAVLNTILTDASGRSLLTPGQGTLAAAVFVTALATLAGLLSLASADIVNGIIITGTLFIALPLLWGRAGGLPGISAAYEAMGKGEHLRIGGVFSGVELVNFCLPAFLLVMGDANQYQRFFASRNARGARSAVIVLVFAVWLIESLIILEAWIASSLIPHPEQGRYVLIYAARDLLPAAVGILFMITIVGIILSTANSFLLIPATTVTRDIYVSLLHPEADARRVIFVNRALVVVFGVIGYLVSLAFAADTTIFEKALYAYTIYGVSITPCLVASFFWKRATPAGAIASILSGVALTLLWGEVIQPRLGGGWLGQMDAVLPAMAVSIIALVAGSLLSSPQSPRRA